MDQAIRNKLRGVVTQCRRLLEDSVRDELQGKFGVYAARKDDVQVDDEARMTNLGDEERAARKDILDHFAHIKARGFKPKEALDQLVREVAFTHLNRLCAYKMMEARQVFVGDQRFREAVSRGVNSNGVKFYLADHPEDERLFKSGQQDVAYRHFLDWLGGLLSEEIGVLFSPHDPANRLYPPQRVLDEVLALINDESLADIWTQDETIGWVYQYFTPKELRDQARKESQAPRNSYELAFRNQFFTPRYVVEFLTDNTLGRIWYEMRKGDTKLKDQCRYMVRRPSEVFLAEGQKAPEDAAKDKDDLPQEELLKLPVYVPHRPKKDPRELKILDPACGSGHFLLYCFDLLLTIYEEAYADPDLGPALKREYPTLDALRRAVPRLILAHNLHGIDIDLRASQIAALALWLRCQRAYQDMGLKKDRPKITRSNFVCAEPMPGEEHMLKEFVGQIEPKLLGQLVEVVFDKMKLAGEAGSLLKIEEEIRDAVAEARRQWLAGPVSIQKSLFDDDQPVVKQQRFDFSGITDAEFFEQAEAKVVEALRNYAEKAQNGQRLQRRLFTEDAVRGFAFVDLCHERFDVVLMNPPFGDGSLGCAGLLSDVLASSGRDLGCAFVAEASSRMRPQGLIGALLTATPLFQPSFSAWRCKLLLGEERSTTVLAHLGGDVLDEATVIVCALVLAVAHTAPSPFLRLLKCRDKDSALLDRIRKFGSGLNEPDTFVAVPDEFRRLKGAPVSYSISRRFRDRLSSLPALEGHYGTSKQGLATADEFRFARAWWEVAGERWINYSKSSEYSPFWDDPTWLLNYGDDGKELRETGRARVQGTAYFGKPGVTYPSKSVLGFNPRAHPAGAAFGHSGSVVFPTEVSPACLLGYLGSRPAEYALSLLTGTLQGEAGFRPVHYEVSVVGSLAFPELSTQDQESIAAHATSAVQTVRTLFRSDETSRDFVSPILADRPSLASYAVGLHRREIEAVLEVKRIQSHIDELVTASLQLAPLDRQEIDLEFESRVPPTTGRWRGFFGAKPDEVDLGEITRAILSYCLGSVVGRWDLRYAVGATVPPPLADPFLPTPARPIGMLVTPVTQHGANSESAYPLRIDWDGILVDDPDRPDDIVRRVRDVLEVIWRDRAEVIEKEACEILDVKELRDYFRKPGKGGFWDDHVSRYSKSRRKAPIYWLLQSSKKNYAFWLYYHRLDKDLLFKALVNYVEPKIRLEDSRLETLRTQKAAAGDSGREAKRLGKEVERQEEFLSELRDFEDKLRRAANLHLEPDLNDGVVLNIAPLHELVPWKEAKTCWQELLDGKYEWSSIAKQLRQKELVK